MTDPAPRQLPDGSQGESRPYQRILYGLLGFIFVLAVFGFVFYTNRAQLPELNISPLEVLSSLTPSPSPTITVSATITPTLRVTFTSKPTQTSTASPTSTATLLPTLPPSLTPAIPVEENERYRLAAWNPERASELIALLEAYPETLSDFARRSDNSGYFSAFKIPLLAQREALLRFSTAPQAEEWQWQTAYNFARTGDKRAGELYANLISAALNSQRVTLNGLYDWGLRKNPPIMIQLVPLEIPSGYLSNNLAKVNLGENGSTFFWLLEKTTGFNVYPLTTDFDFINPTTVNYFIEDLIGGGDAVVGIYRSSNPDSTTYSYPRVFNLIEEPPVELPFEPATPPQIGPNFQGSWSTSQIEGGMGSLKFTASVFPACPVTIRHHYRWNGRAFSLSRVEYTLNPESDLLAYCELIVDQAVNVWGLETAVQFMENILPDWPPAQNLQGAPYPAEAQDIWRFRLAIYHALLGHRDQAIGYSNSVIENPSSADSAWIEPAREFQSLYQTQRGVYRACLITEYCDPQMAIHSLVKTILPDEFPQLIEILRDAGVFIRAHGYYDFDNDHRTERWVAIRHFPGAPLELWIFFQLQNEVITRFVSNLATDFVRFKAIEPLTEPPLIRLDPEIYFKIEKQGVQRAPFIVMTDYRPLFSVDRMHLDLDILEEDLLSGIDPETIRQELIKLGESPFFTCTFQLCPRYFYLLGLSSELAGKERQAVEAYLDIWRRFLDSPFATMARFKLEGPSVPPGPTITPTFTQTRPVTATQTRTPTITGTPPTATPTFTQTSPPTLTPTVTDTPPGYNPPP